MELASADLRNKIKSLPDKPGIYKYFDSEKNVIYVGKAKNIRKRVTSYFQKVAEHAKTRLLVKKIRDISYIVANTEQDALLLENNLIKELQPKYNIQLKDDKTYPWICLKKEPFPRVFSTRRVIRDGSLYFGPYPNVKLMHTILRLIRELFPLRTCSLDLSDKRVAAGKYKVCLEYHIGRCLAPCVGLQSAESYDDTIRKIVQILKGNSSELLQGLKKQMLELSSKLAFEEADKVKQQIQLLEKYQARSTVVSPSIRELDVFTLLESEDCFFCNYLMVKNGAIIHAYNAQIEKKLNETAQEVMGYALPELRNRFGSKAEDVLITKETSLLLPGIRFFVPQRGEKRKLLEMSERNTYVYQTELRKQENRTHPERNTQRVLQHLMTDFRLPVLPIHMECFDNSNIQGQHAVSACVVFKDAKPSKKDYRHYNVKTVDGPDDFKTMEEVVYRRYSRLLMEEKALPQLVIIDGGKGQLGSALQALEKLGLTNKMHIVGIAKRLEEIYFPGHSTPLILDKRSESLKVIQHMRNEAHRFGITHHRNKRSKAALVSEITSIPGIGQKTMEILMQNFHSVHRIKKQSFKDISQLVGIKKAKSICEFLGIPFS